VIQALTNASHVYVPADSVIGNMFKANFIVKRHIGEDIEFEIFWFVTPCSVVVKYQRFRGPYCPHLHGEVNGAWKRA